MSETKYEYDLFVIGTGPGGEGAAMQARKGGLRVAVAEDHPQIGGNCTHHGTIPSKALRHTITATVRAMSNPTIQAMGVQLSPTMDQLRRGSQTIVSRQVTMRQSFYDRNGVPIYRGTAHFVDEHTVQIGVRRVTAKNFVLAPGTRPFRPAEVDFNHPCVFDSDTILDIKNRPVSITVYGAGVIGCEYASMFRDLGSKVNLVNTRSKLLEFLDDEIIDALSYHLRDRGVIIRHNEEMESVQPLDDGVILTLKSGKRLKSEAFLWANGRSGNVEKLALSKVGLTPDSRGQLSVNEHFQTSTPHIFAVGDVIGYPSLASAAYTQGRAAAMYMLGESDEDIRAHDIPTGIYTSPEISSVGKTERELTAARVPYEVGQAQFRSLARAQITGDTVGMLKILFNRDTLKILGVHCFGANASEIVHIGQAIMDQPGEGNTLKYFTDTTFNYPTMAEAYRVAALNGYNRLF